MSNPTIAIASRTFGQLTETFIRQHVDLSPFPVVKVEGPTLSKVNGSQPPLPFRDVVLEGAKRRWVKRTDPDYEDPALRLRRDQWTAVRWRELGVAAVLGEYGHRSTRLLNACAMADLPLIAHFHGHDATRRSILDRYADSYRRLFQQSTKIIAVSDAMADDLTRLGASSEKIEVIRYYVPLLEEGMTDVAATPPRLLAVGRFVPKKAQHLTIQAFATAAPDVPQAQLVMIGGGPELAACRRLAKRLGLGRRVLFLGPQQNSAVRAALRTARAFVQHSIVGPDGDCEGTPVAALEAMASGLPLIATRHKGLGEVIEDGVTGYCGDEHDVDAMARAMMQLLNDPAQAAAMGREGHHRLRTRYHFAATLGRLYGVIGSVASRPEIGTAADAPGTRHAA